MNDVLTPDLDPGTGEAVVIITPGSVDLDLGAQTLLDAGVFRDGNRVPAEATFTWSSLNPEIASVDESGVVTAQAWGVASIVAAQTCCDGSGSDTAIVVVRQVPVSIEVSVPALSVAANESAILSATVKDLAGRPISNAPVSWSSSNAEIATVWQGVITGISGGTAVIYASVDALAASASVTVTTEAAPEAPGGGSPGGAAPDEDQPRDQPDQDRPRETPGDDGDGGETPSDPGTAVLTRIAITPSSAVVGVNASTQLRAVALDQNGRSMSGLSFAWSTSNPVVAVVNASGLVLGVAPGTTLISASAGGKINTALVTVSATPVPPAPLPPPPAPTGPFSPPDIAATDFSTGTSSPFTVASGSVIGNADITILPDPTGRMGGQVARIHYVRSSPSWSPDVNRALQYRYGVSHGETVFMRGRILIPTPAANMMSAMRKLFYVQTGGPSSSFCVIKADGQSLKAEITNSRMFRIGSIAFDRPFSVEAQIMVNSAPGAPDGVFRVWLDGTLVVDQTDVEWIDTQSAGATLSRFLFGQQTQMDAATTFDEYRYWDNIAISTKRIGP